MRDATIEDYKWLYENTSYMRDGIKCAEPFLDFIKCNKSCTYLDYGCGRGSLVRWINSIGGDAVGYDPATRSGDLRVSDYVICCDVLEHIHEKHLKETIAALQSYSTKGMLLTIANMNDIVRVRNEQVQLHLIREPMHWWEHRLGQYIKGWCSMTGMQINSDRFAIQVTYA